MLRSMPIWVFGLVIFFLGEFAPRALAQSRAVAVNANTQVNLLGFGDWGVDSPDHQAVAATMAAYVAKSARPFDGALSLGDNFYVPLTSADDPAFKKLFDDTYDARRMNFPFWAVLGNHDYDAFNGHVKYEWEIQHAAIHPDSRWKMPARWYRLDLPPDHPLVTILMLDSNKENANATSLTPVEWTDELEWLQKQLAGPRAIWTLCCAHHTIYCNGSKGDNGVLIQQWGALFEKYKVDFYLCGHNHTIQHIDPAGVFTSYVISGGGGAARDGLLRDDRGFSISVTGFAAFQFDRDMATVSLLRGNGATLHSFVRTKSGTVKVLQSLASGPKSKKPLRLIQGLPDAPATQAAADSRGMN